jgi:hypothetical protein
MNPNGAAVERLTNHPERDFEPAWSPDGTNRETEISRQDIVDLALIAALVAVGVYII